MMQPSTGMRFPGNQMFTAAQAGQGGLEHSPRASLIRLMVTASEDQPSKASTTMGIKSMPAERQVDS